MIIKGVRGAIVLCFMIFLLFFGIGIGLVIIEDLVVIDLMLFSDFILPILSIALGYPDGGFSLPVWAFDTIVLEFASLQFDRLVVFFDEVFVAFQDFYALPTGLSVIFPTDVIQHFSTVDPTTEDLFDLHWGLFFHWGFTEIRL